MGGCLGDRRLSHPVLICAMDLGPVPPPISPEGYGGST